MKIKNITCQSQLWLRQFFDPESSTYTYLLVDPESGEGALIDSVKEKVQRDLKLLHDLEIKLKFLLETHIHADHITGAWSIKEAIGAQIAVGRYTGAKNPDRFLSDGEEIFIGTIPIKAILTPGHTNGCVTFSCDGRLFTGDALMIRGCGRTDFQEGSSSNLFESVRKKIFSFPDETLIYPGHDYNGNTVSTVGEEKLYNPRLQMANSLEQFEQIMSQLNLSYPKKFDVAVPANLKCGQTS